MEQVRAKFVVNTKSEVIGGTSVIMNPVVSGSAENKSFSDYTPSGKIELFITRGKEAINLFEVPTQAK